MFIISIKIHTDIVPQDKADEMLKKHREWFKRHFDDGKFLLLGPYKDQENAGVIVAKLANKVALDEILSGDVYYPNLASYEVREFHVAMAVNGLAE